MVDHRAVGAGRTFVPNRYRLMVAPDTVAAFSGFEAALGMELEAFVARRAREEDLVLVGAPSVELVADPGMRADDIRVDADLVEASPRPGSVAQGTTAIDLAPRPAPKVSTMALIIPGRAPIPLAGNEIGLGRALDNDVVLPEETVSRHHARLTPVHEHWLLEDLGSTHGTFVNGRRVTRGMLRCGDEVRLGAAVFQLRLYDRDSP